MRHQSQNVSPTIANAGDAGARSVYVRTICNLTIGIAITKDDSIVAIQFRERRIIANKISFRMRNRHFQNAAGLQLMREWSIRALDAHIYMVADEMQIAISNQSTRQEARFAQNLKAVTNAEHEFSLRGEF